ncbi:chymotrypsin-like elastase family member 2A [Haliotis cracherodii]|uniref:chymotrypsin-like elastase family member 2A n=1 Tax=Haliotis cracherodii TaxID=6455 RepID=UPI0039E96ECE
MLVLALLILEVIFTSPNVEALFYSRFARNRCWRFCGQCRASCDPGEFMLGPVPCGFGALGTCCAAELPCSAYGGVCRRSGCLSLTETEYTYKVRCFNSQQTCCLRRPEGIRSFGPFTMQPIGPTSRPNIFSNCGGRRIFSSRILGGSPVDSPSQWPWMVSIKTGSPSSGTHICAGVLIRNNRVLTTASCAESASTMYVTITENNINNQGEIGETDIRVRGTMVHPAFGPPRPGDTLQGNDIAILTLESSAPVPAQPACLPRAAEDILPATRCFIAGWGFNAASDGLLHESRVNVVNNAVCSIVLALGVNSQLPPDKLCSAPFIDRTDACQGDNGGMLVCEQQPNVWTLIGVISDNACSQTLPVVYTDVRGHIPWILPNL